MDRNLFITTDKKLYNYFSKDKRIDILRIIRKSKIYYRT